MCQKQRIFLLRFDMCDGVFSEVEDFSCNKKCILISGKCKEYLRYSEHLSIFCYNTVQQYSNVRNVNPGGFCAVAVRTFTDRDAFNFCRIRMLIGEGYEDRILMAHDVHTKNRLMKYGGHGYSHIFKNIVPKMLIRGISQDKIDKILLANPKQWLTFK